MMELTLECLGDFSSVCEKKEKMLGSIDEILKYDKRERKDK